MAKVTVSACTRSAALLLCSLCLGSTSTVLGSIELLATGDFGNGTTATPDGFADVLLRDTETGSLTILYLDHDGQEPINTVGPVTRVDVLDGGWGYQPAFGQDDAGTSMLEPSGSDVLRLLDAGPGLHNDWSGYLVDGTRGVLRIESYGPDGHAFKPLDTHRHARTRIVFAHFDGGVGYDSMHDVLYADAPAGGMPLEASLVLWDGGATAGDPVAMAAPGRVHGMQAQSVFVPIPGGPIGEGYIPNVAPPGLPLALTGGVERAGSTTADGADSTRMETVLAAVRTIYGTRFESVEPIEPTAFALTDHRGRLTHVAWTPGTMQWDVGPTFEAPATASSDGRGILELKLQGQINHVDVRGEQAGAGFMPGTDATLSILSDTGFGATPPSATVATGTITEVVLLGDSGIWQRPPRLDPSPGGGQSAVIRCRLGDAGTGEVQFRGQMATMGSNWTAHVADFNEDGVADLFWYDGTRGQSAVWLLGDEAKVLHSQFGFLPTVSPSWTVGAVVDFDAGTPGANVFWRNTVTGENSIWGIDATAPWSHSGSWLHEESTIVQPVAESEWSVVGADTSGTRLLWWNRRTGICATWHLAVDMSGGVSSEHWLLNADWLTNPRGQIMAPDTAWRPIGLANLAGRAPGRHSARDIAWWHPQTGRTAIWLMKPDSLQVDHAAAASGADYVTCQGENATVGPNGWPLIGQTTRAVDVGRQPGESGQSSEQPRTFTNLFWGLPAADVVTSWRMARSIDRWTRDGDGTGLLKDPAAVESSVDIR